MTEISKAKYKRARKLLNRYIELKDAIVMTNLEKAFFDSMIWDIEGYREELFAWDENSQVWVYNEDTDLLEDLQMQVRAFEKLIEANDCIDFKFS